MIRSAEAVLIRREDRALALQNTKKAMDRLKYAGPPSELETAPVRVRRDRIQGPTQSSAIVEYVEEEESAA
jgi:hypothetical protein